MARPGRVFRDYVARTVPQALGVPTPGAIPLPTQNATPPWMGPQGAAAMGLPQPTGPVAPDTAQVAALLATLARMRTPTPQPAAPAQPTPTPDQAAAVQAYLQQQGAPAPPARSPYPRAEPDPTMGHPEEARMTEGERKDAARKAQGQYSAVYQDYLRTHPEAAAAEIEQRAGDAVWSPLETIADVAMPALAALDVPRQENIEHVIGPIIKELVTGDVNDWAASVAGALPMVGPILNGLNVLQESLNDTQFAAGMRQAYAQGYNGFTGNRAVWEYMVGQTDDWNPVARFIVLALANTAVDPLTLLPTLGKIGASLRSAARASKAARGVGASATATERLLDVGGRTLQVPTAVLDRPVDVAFDVLIGKPLRAAGRKVGGLFDLTTNQRVRDIAEEELEPTLVDVERARAQPARTSQVTQTDYFGPGGSLAPDETTLALDVGGITGETVVPRPPSPAVGPIAPPPPGYGTDQLLALPAPALVTPPPGATAPSSAAAVVPVGDRRMFQGRIIRTVGTDGTVRVKETRDGRWVVQVKERGTWIDRDGAATEERALDLARDRIIRGGGQQVRPETDVEQPFVVTEEPPPPAVTPPPSAAAQTVVPPPPTPEPPVPQPWWDRLRGMTPEERSAQITAGRISKWTPTEGGDRIIDRAYYTLGDQHPERRTAFEAEIAAPTRARWQADLALERQRVPDFDRKKFEQGLTAAEHMADVIIPAYRRHFGDLDPLTEIPIPEPRKQATTPSGKASYRDEDPNYLASRAVFTADEKDANAIIRAIEGRWKGAPWRDEVVTRIRAARAKVQQLLRDWLDEQQRVGFARLSQPRHADLASDVGQTIRRGVGRLIPDLVGTPEQGFIPPTFEGATGWQGPTADIPALGATGPVAPRAQAQVPAEVQFMHETGRIDTDQAALLSERVTVDPSLFAGPEKLAKTTKRATPAGTITVQNPTEMTVLDFVDELKAAGFADARILRETAEAVARARGILPMTAKERGAFTRGLGKVLRPVLRGYDATIGEMRNLIQFNITNAARGPILDTVSDGYKAALMGHPKLLLRAVFQPRKTGRMTKRAFAGIRENDSDAMKGLYQDVDELGIMREVRAPGSRSEVDTSGRTAVERLEEALHAPRSASFIFSSSIYRDIRHAGDELRRMEVFAEVVRREHQPAVERFIGVLRRQAAKEGVDPQQWIDGIQASAQSRGKTTGVFDAEDVLQGTGNTDLARAWKRELNTLKKAGHDAEQKIFFSYKQTNADAFLRRTMFFSYWMSRELALHARLTLKNPAILAAYYRFWEGWKQVAEDEGYPASVRGMIGFMQETVGGWASVFDPVSYLVPYTMFMDITDNAPLVDKLGVFFNPIVQGAAAAWGLTERTPDLSATYGVRSLIRAVADFGAAQGLDFLGHFGGGDGAIDRWQRRIFERVNELATSWDVPGAQEYEPFNPGTNQIDMLRSVVMANAQEQGIPIDSPQVQDAFAAIESGDYESNPLAEDAFKEWSAARLFGRLVGLFLPNRTRYGPRDEAIVGNQAFGEAIGAGQTPTPESEAAYLEREQATATDPALVSQTEQFYNLGTERQRNLHSGWNDIVYGVGWGGSVLYIGNRVIQGGDLVQMEPEQREAVANLWVAEYDGAQELESYRTLRDDFITKHPQFAEYDEYRDLAFDYEGGVREFRTDMAQNHPEFADELEERRAFFRGEGKKGEVLEKELDQWATSQAGYHAFRGEKNKIYDESPEPAYDVSSDPYLSVGGTGGEAGGGKKSAPKGTARQLIEELAEYQRKDQQMQAILGASFDSFDPRVQQVVAGQYGDAVPRKTQLMQLYEQWVVMMQVQNPQADTSPAAFAAYMDQLEQEALLGLLPAA